jgi:tetratricopeptide (TPR) repeat protein
MKKGSCMKLLKTLLLAICAIGLLNPLSAARKAKSGVDYKANDMLSRGLDFITQGDKGRGLELIKSIPQQYPSSPVKFKAYQALGSFFLKKKDYTQAVKFFKLASASKEEEVQAASFYQSGICYYSLNSYDRAFATLRKVIANYPDSVYANEAFYYIGMCHFKLKRWSRAVEALELVGTRVTELEKGAAVKAESSQRLFIKIKDSDLVVLPREEGKTAFKVKVTTEKGDSEVIEMTHLGKSNEEYIGSLQTVSAKAKASDGLLQTVGNEKVTVTYIDKNTIAGKTNQQLIAKVEMVSTASVGFTDGAYDEFVEGVFAGQKFFVRIKDFDRDISDKKDKITIDVAVRYTVSKEEDLTKDGIQLDDEDEAIETRDSMKLVLEESSEHSGLFVGYAMVAANDTPESEKAELTYVNGDYLQLEYTDEVNLQGDPRALMAKAIILNSGIQDVRIVHREVDSNTIKAKKELIEAKIFLKLSDIFKNVGLADQAAVKADQGLERVNSVISLTKKFRLKRKIAEEAYNVKWDIYIVKGDFSKAIGTCNQLIALYPDSTLIDNALMKVAQAKIGQETAESSKDAIQILAGITRLKSSELKAEAQFMIATATENLAIKSARLRGQLEVNLSSAMRSYKTCLDLYPDSEYAGKALEKISNFYMGTSDYQRVVELMEQVFQDYPDASFLDVMLYKWAYASYKINNFVLAREKAEQLVNDYPNSKFSANATKMIGKIDANKKEK